MAVAFGASGALGAASSGTSITPALPAGITAGQLLIGIVGTKNNATHTWPAGWTKQAQVNSGASWTVSWATRQASGADSAPAVSWAGSVANTGIIGRWTGADLFNPIGAIGTAGAGTVSPHTSAAITTLRDNSLCIYLDSCAVATAITVPSGYATEINSTSATSATVISTGDKTVATNGTSTGAISTAGGAAAWVQWQIELMSPAPLSTGRVPFADQYTEAVSIPNWASDSISIPPIMRAMALGPPLTSHIPGALRYVPDPGWVGTPQEADTLILATAPPPPVVTYVPRAPVYVPKLDQTAVVGWAWDPMMLGPLAVGLPLIGPPPFSSRWASQYTFEPDKLWLGAPTDNPPLWQLSKPFAKPLWRWDFEPDKGWYWDPNMSGPQGSALLLPLLGKKPFFNEWANLYTFEPDKIWLGTPISSDPSYFPVVVAPLTIARAPVYVPKAVDPGPWQQYSDALNILLAAPPAPLKAKQWRYDFDVEPSRWTGTPLAADALYIPRLAPFSKQWRYDLITDTQWSWQGTGSAVMDLLTAGGAPFSKQWRYDFEPDKLWLGTPEASLALYIPKPQPLNKQLWRWDYDVEAPNKWQGAPVGSNTINALTSGGAPFFKQWRYDLDFDKYWQGSPQPTNIRFFPFVVPFSKQWRYDLEFDKLWTGEPQASQSLIMLSGTPFFKQWEYNLEPDKYWQGQPTQTNIRFFPFVEPFSKQWEYNLEPDKYWQGAPIGSNTINVPTINPAVNKWAALTAWDSGATYWQRYSLPALSLEILVEGGKPFFKQWRWDLEPDKYWQGSPVGYTAVPPGAQPFSKQQWRSDYHIEQPLWLGSPITSLQALYGTAAFGRSPFWAPRPEWDKYWQGAPAPTNLRFFPILAPFFRQWRYDLITDTWWQGAPTPTNTQFLKPTAPIPKLWRYDWDSDVRLWQRYSSPSASLSMLVEGGVPASNRWFIQYTYDMEAWGRWQGIPKTAYSIYLAPVEPPHNEWYKQYEFDSGQTLWQWAGTSAAALTGLAVAGKPFFQQWRYDFVPSPDWVFTSQPSDTLWIHTMGGKPTFKQWRYDFEPDKFWQGQPIQTNIEFFPFVFPFSKEWSSLFAWDSGATFWQGTPTAPFIGRIPVLAPFSNEWFQLPWDSGATFWQGKPIPTSVSTIPRPPASSIEWYSQYTWDSGQTFWQGKPLPLNQPMSLLEPFSNEWASLTTWDSGASYWQGRPTSLFTSLVPQVPASNKWAALYTLDSDVRLWRHADYVRQNSVIMFKFFPKMVQSTYKWESIDIPAFWQGRPTFLPPFLINVAIAVFNPDDMLPRFGHPLFPRRKDPLFLRGDDLRRSAIPDEPLFPRRKDPLK